MTDAQHAQPEKGRRPVPAPRRRSSGMSTSSSLPQSPPDSSSRRRESDITPLPPASATTPTTDATEDQLTALESQRGSRQSGHNAGKVSHSDSVDSLHCVSSISQRPSLASLNRVMSRQSSSDSFSPQLVPAPSSTSSDDKPALYSTVNLNARRRSRGAPGSLSSATGTELFMVSENASLFSLPQSNLTSLCGTADPASMMRSVDSCSSFFSVSGGVERKVGNESVHITASQAGHVLVYAVPAGEDLSRDKRNSDPCVGNTLTPFSQVNHEKRASVSSIDMYIASFTGSITPLALVPHRSIRGKGMLGTYRGRTAADKKATSDLPPGMVADLEAVARGTVFMKAQTNETPGSCNNSHGMSVSKLAGGYDFLDFPTARTVTVLRVKPDITMPEV